MDIKWLNNDRSCHAANIFKNIIFIVMKCHPFHFKLNTLDISVESVLTQQQVEIENLKLYI